VGTDFSDSSGYALQVALRLFPAEQLRLLYAHEALYVTQVIDPASYQDAHQHEAYRQALEGQLETFLASLSLPGEARRRIHTLIEFGPPEALFRDYVFHHEADLVVLGTHGRHAALEALIGSTAKRIVSMLPCDALIVRQPPPAAHAPR
jgi:nucleotide-binding universal stress UspA family protein